MRHPRFARAARVGLALAAAALMSGCLASPVGGGRGGGGVIQAEQLAESGEYREALRLLDAVIAENPTLTSAHMTAGSIHLESDNYEDAERSYRRAVVLAELERDDPAEAEANLGHGTALQALGRLYDAVRAYLRTLEIQPNNAQANARLASAYLELGEARSALPFAERAKALDANDGIARANLAAIYAALGRHDEATREYEAALELTDLSPALLLGLAESLGKLQRYTEMANTLRTLLRIESSAPTYERLGFAEFKLRRYDVAERAFRDAVELDPAHFPALNGLGVVLLNTYLLGGREDEEAKRESIRLMEQSLAVNANQPRITELIERFR